MLLNETLRAVAYFQSWILRFQHDDPRHKARSIRARLGDLDKPRVYDPYNNAGAWQDIDIENEEAKQNGSTINAGFIATILGLFISVSGGTYMYSAGINPLQGE